MIKTISPRYTILKTNSHKGFRNDAKRTGKVTSAKEWQGKDHVLIEITKQCSDRVVKRLLIETLYIKGARIFP